MITTDYLIMPFKLGVPRANNGTDDDIYTSIIKEIEYCIDLYERNYLKAILGSELYAEYISDMSSQETAAKWADFNAKLIFDDKAYISPIANYIFYNYLTRNAVNYVDGRYEIGKSEGFDRMSIEEQKNKVWNEMVEMNQTLLTWFYSNLPETTAALDYSKWDYMTTPKYTHLCFN